jgi:RimJ/RimL family protein N-acetyltransferase
LAGLFVASVAGEARGFALYKKLPWDSAIFDFGCGRIEYLGGIGSYEESLQIKRALLSAIVEQCQRDQIATLHSRTSLSDLSTIHALESSGFQLIVVARRYYFTTRRALPPLKDLVPVRPSEDKDLEALKTIARTSFFPSRYSLDPRFPQVRVHDLYAQWVENACRGSVQDIVIVAERQGEVVGFVTCGIEHEFNTYFPVRLGSVHLAAASQASQGRGVVPSCWKAGLQWFSDKVQLIETVIAIQNEATARIAVRFGGRYGDACVDFHRWF